MTAYFFSLVKRQLYFIWISAILSSRSFGSSLFVIFREFNSSSISNISKLSLGLNLFLNSLMTFHTLPTGQSGVFQSAIALALTYLQPHLFFCKFSNPQFLAQFNQVPLRPTNQFLSSQTEVGHSQHTHIPWHSYIVSQIKFILHFLDNLQPRQVERPDLVGK